MTRDEARSDLFLSGAVYLIGPAVIRLLLDIVPLDRIPGVGAVLEVLLPLATTALVPYLLLRYRRESLRQYGLGTGPSPTFAFGALLALPLVAATLLSSAVAGAPLSSALPVVAVGPGALVALLSRLAFWLGLAFLAVYGTVKARDAFMSEARTVRGGIEEIGRWLGIASIVATLLLLAAIGFSLEILLLPLAVAASVYLLLRSLRGASATTRAALLTPVVLLALGPFRFTFRADLFVFGVWAAALAGGIGLMIGALQETRRSALGAFGLALVVALFTGLGFDGR